MPVIKRSLSFDEDVVAEADRAADEDGVPFSAWVSEAVKDRLAVRDGRAAVREWEREHGALTSAERAVGHELLTRLLAESG